MNKKFVKNGDFNKKGEDILELFKEYQGAKDIVKQAILTEVEKLCSRVKPMFTTIQTEKELRDELLKITSLKKLSSDYVEDARKFIVDNLDTDVLFLDIKTNPTNKSIIIFRRIGIKKYQVPTIFNVPNNEKEINKYFDTFVKEFMNLYVHKNVKNYVQSINDNKNFSVKATEVYFTGKYYDVNIEFDIPLDKLDTNILFQISSLIEMMPKFY